ncbi:FBXO28 [Lepeophtheirus salmonis]|uniref:FBXO28 n=1 Tax=Lepeophtheirus salmonis TaxID=72036 RepID=A0A7R8H249_LEPSM|nr:FBXO28 [Lepeophtheirus salmonis]CAF2818576.1 FBXO28 [Lepeophtheirus salmonis]
MKGSSPTCHIMKSLNYVRHLEDNSASMIFSLASTLWNVSMLLSLRQFGLSYLVENLRERGHPLSRHSEVLASIETRLSLLNMTFMKICSNVKKFNIPKPFDLLQELRDISSMSMEYFDEQILPSLEVSSNNSSTEEYLRPNKKSNSKNRGINAVINEYLI